MGRKSALYLISLSIVLLGLFALLPDSHVKAQDQQGSVVGTWQVTASLNVPPGAPPFVFTELASFNPGGTVIDTFSLDHNSANPYVPPPLAVDFSDKFGTWREVGNSNQVALTFKEFLFAGANTPTSAYGSFFAGQNVGVATVEAVLNLQSGAAGGTAAGPFTFQLTNLQGTIVFAGSGTVTATRLQIQPLATP